MIGRTLLSLLAVVHITIVKLSEWRGWSSVRVASARLRGAKIGDGAIIERGCYLAGTRNIIIGDDVYLGYGSSVVAYGSEVSIGSGTRVAAGCRIISRNHDIHESSRLDAGGYRSQPVRIGADVWLGYNVVVLPGVEVGDRAAVGAGAVVTKSVAPGEIVGGVPATRIGMRAPMDCNS